MKFRLAVIAAAFLSGTLPALAHHSFAMFDREKEIKLAGQVREFQWTNPHIWIELTVLVNGKAVNYSIEGPSPNALTRRGWKRSAFKAGDKVTLTVNPLKNGGPGGSLVSAIRADGSPISIR